MKLFFLNSSSHLKEKIILISASLFAIIYKDKGDKYYG